MKRRTDKHATGLENLLPTTKRKPKPKQKPVVPKRRNIDLTIASKKPR